jgi:hypothetical protein
MRAMAAMIFACSMRQTASMVLCTEVTDMGHRVVHFVPKKQGRR